MGFVKLGVLLAILLGAALAAGEVGVWLAPKAKTLLSALLAGAESRGVPVPAITFDVLWTLVKVILVLHVPLLSALVFVWWERKISAHMQSRLGPMYVGGFHGWAQTIADGIKLLLKENITPDAADPWVHRLAPAVVVAPAILAFAPVCFGKELTVANIDVGLVYVFAMSGVSVVGIMMAGWGSGNKYSLLGGLRSAAQLVSYELPRMFSIVPVVMFAGSLNLTAIADAQAGYWMNTVPRWFIFYPVVGQISFLVFLIASVAETNRIPFDIPEAESELVAGFHTEYSGMKFSLFFLAEYAYMTLACCLSAAFFFGGGGAPAAFLEGTLPSWAWFLGKVLALVFVFLWFRWTFPRFRVDRLMDFNWKFLLPWSFANIALAGLYVMF
ncbi:MAG: NADH-quinone oxidoreductase subunit NuoH [Elusimicrobia bacterium]|nr:NADH-quinone oxidoreductase subunit NuoH [Elusimicrobiota bacterium]